MLLAAGLAGVTYALVHVWRWGNGQARRVAAAEAALAAAMAAHAADLRQQIVQSRAHARYFQKFAKGFEAGSNRLKHYKNDSPPPE